MLRHPLLYTRNEGTFSMWVVAACHRGVFGSAQQASKDQDEGGSDRQLAQGISGGGHVFAQAVNQWHEALGYYQRAMI